jgi:hypothetical protein
MREQRGVDGRESESAGMNAVKNVVLKFEIWRIRKRVGRKGS